jgi:hypothetical protein
LKKIVGPLQGGAGGATPSWATNSPHNPFFTGSPASPCPRQSKKAKGGYKVQTSDTKRVFTSPYLVGDGDSHAHQPLVKDLEHLCLPMPPTPPPYFPNLALPTTPEPVRPRDVFVTGAMRNRAAGKAAAGGPSQWRAPRSRVRPDNLEVSDAIAAAMGKASRSSDGASNSRGGCETPAGVSGQRAADTAPGHRGWQELPVQRLSPSDDEGDEMPDRGDMKDFRRRHRLNFKRT